MGRALYPSAMDPRLKKTLLAKGQEVAAKLEALLNHKEVDLTQGIPFKDPNEDPEVRLRRFLEQIDRAIKAFGTERFGRCTGCGEPIAEGTLNERPWTERCPLHP